MIQEIITYIIVIAAVVYAVLQMYKKLFRKRKNSRQLKVNLKQQTFTLQHNCSSCSAECMLRNSVKPFSGADASLCKQIEVKPKL